MLLRIILEALVLLPSLAEDIQLAVDEMHSNDATGVKAQRAAQTASHIITAAARIAATMQPKAPE